MGKLLYFVAGVGVGYYLFADDASRLADSVSSLSDALNANTQARKSPVVEGNATDVPPETPETPGE